MHFRDVRPRSMRRGYLHRYRVSFSNLLVVAFVLTLGTALPAIAANFISVTSLADDGSAGTLRSAIASANSGDLIGFTVAGTITLVQGVLEINKNLTISRKIAPGQLTISGNHVFQVFYVDPGAAVTISQLSITQGMAPPNTSNCGGGVLNTGTLTLDGVVVSGNSAGNVGGGLYNAGSMTVTNSTVSNNSASSDGGGIYNVGTLIVSSTSFSGNTAGDVGGGFTNYSGTASVSGSVLSGNSASFGGGAIAGANGGGTLTLTNSTLSGNTASTGGGIWEAASTIFVINSTIAGNTASNGGGVAGPGGHLTLKNTIVANNMGGNCSSGGSNSNGHNLSDDTSCSPFFTAIGDLNNIPAQLDPAGLQDNGSTVTKTIALLLASPAINAVPISPSNFCTAIDGTTPIATDQRGILRPQDFACDIGAFELDIDTDGGLAILNGSNTFTGNQTVNGTLAATAVTGNGSGLTAISPANISPGTAAINITGAAASATNATNAVNATTAGNALNLAGVAAAQYARLDIGNSFNGDQSVTGNVSGSGNLRVGGTTTMGGGTPIVEHLSATFNPSFPALKPSMCATANFTFAGTIDGDTIALGVPNARMAGGGTLQYAAWVSAANTITIRACNIDPNIKQTTAGTGTIRVDLWRH